MRSIPSLINLSRRSALITGGAGHIGSTMAEALLECGAKVILLDKGSSALDSAYRRLSDLFPKRVRLADIDLADERVVTGTIPKVISDGLDILIHSAAYVGTTVKAGWAESFDQQSVDAWDAALRVNLTSAFRLSQLCRKPLEASGHGTILFLASIYGLVAPDFKLYKGTSMHNPAGYAASKGGLLQLMKYLSTALAPRIRVNAISPGGVKRGQAIAFIKRYESRTPLGRMASEEDIKGAAIYLASDLSAYVTGHNLVVDGGWTSW